MPLYLSETQWDADRPLRDVLAELEQLVERTGGQVTQVLQLDDRLSITFETPDDLSMFRIAREATDLGLQITTRVALSRQEAEALDRAHRERLAEEFD